MSQFRLQPIIQLRERSRDVAAQNYQQAMLASAQIREQIAELQRQYEDQKPDQISSSLNEVKPQRLLESRRFQLQLQQQVRECEDKLRSILEECERRRLVLVEAERELKSLEKLKEQRQKAATRANLALEQQNLDQWAGYRHWGTTNAATPIRDPREVSENDKTTSNLTSRGQESSQENR